MKKRVALSGLAILFAMSLSFANQQGDVNQKAVTSFQKDFRHATNVNWQFNAQFIKVTFTLDEQVYFAYYNEEGERLALTRNVKSQELPMGLRAQLQESYQGYWISDLFEINAKEEAAYYVTIENADYKITLKSVGMSEWANYKKIEKR